MDFDGRIGRRRYIVSQLVLMPAITASLSALFLALWNLNHGMSTDVIPQILRGMVFPPGLTWVIVALAGVGGIVATIANLSFTVRRLHDIGFSGWFVVLWPIAMLLVAGDYDHPTAGAANCAFETVLMMAPGIAETNIYGPNPHVAAVEPSPPSP